MRLLFIGATGVAAAVTVATWVHAAPAARSAGPPTESLRVVRAAETPLFNEIKNNKAAFDVARAGDLVEVLRPLPPLKWKAGEGMLIGEREGPMVEIRRAPGDAICFGFGGDLGEEVEAPLTSWICEELASLPTVRKAARTSSCAAMLRRSVVPSGAIVAHEPCAVGPCPVASIKNGKVAALAVDGVVLATIVPGGSDGVLLLRTRWSRADGKWTGSTLVPVALSKGKLKRLLEIPVDEVDARDPERVISRHVEAELTSPSPDRTVVRVRGARREVRPADGREYSTSPIDESRVLP